MTKGAAVRPDKYFRNLPSVVKDQEATKGGISVEERHLYSLSNSAGWKVLSKFIDDLLGDLDNVNEAALGEGATFEAIGQNTVVINLAKSVIKRVVNKVKDAEETVENEKK